MDINSIFKFTKEKNFVTDIIFYIAVSFLISCVLCYCIFFFKISSQKQKVISLQESMLTIGTADQKAKEIKIFKYQKKINDYAKFLKEHKSFLNVFTFMENQTLPEVWFSRISLVEKQGNIVLSGETTNMDVLSRQVSLFEKNEFVKKIQVLNSAVGDSGRITFSLSFDLDPKLFIPIQ